MIVNSIRGANPSETWMNAINFIIEKGTRQGELSREILNLVSVTKNPLEIYKEVDDLFRKHIGSKWISKGSSCIFPITSNPGNMTSWSKNYWGRLTRYREKVNQLGFIVRRLKSKPHSKQLSCVTFDPEIDMQPHRPYNPSMPCMIALDIKLRNGKINIFAMFRSHDFGRKAYGNYIGLGKLLNMLCHETGYDIGEVVCYSVSAHIRAKEFNVINTLLEDYKASKFASLKKVEKGKSLETCSLV